MTSTARVTVPSATTSLSSINRKPQINTTSELNPLPGKTPWRGIWKTIDGANNLVIQLEIRSLRKYHSKIVHFRCSSYKLAGRIPLTPAVFLIDQICDSEKLQISGMAIERNLPAHRIIGVCLDPESEMRPGYLVHRVGFP